ncbi:hypothetical protein F4820DRAFT_284650 [Hypoxylon rubiginosum]|uniref:Uncharacterized protein n=1 Tax=Hypoxylon rubiginosum TaxID=110542 RepID=A0ACB9Z2C8_9PEZI|nr:hypothetical protein F4820DRAFT_284650 [Hypoxylon rubiginosum]
MSLQTFVLENDEWVSRTISADELMRDNGSTRKAGRPPPSKPPTCGVLTRTIVDSPVIRWVLPVQLRSARYNDVALISDHSVQICELGHDRQLQDIVKKNDFGSRIRNVVVMGSPQYSRKANEGADDGTHVKTEDSDTKVPDLGTTAPGHRDVNSLLPPQLLILVLERGDLVFLFLRQGESCSWEWVPSTHKVPGQRLVYPGFHMAIDPSSTFLTLACSENLFIVYQLESMEILRAQYLQRFPLQPIKSRIARSVKGIIHKIEFLHPTHGNEVQVILLIIMIQPEVSKLAVLEWDSRSDMSQIFSQEIKGYRLDEDYRMPLLVVPLKVRNAFLIITERITATCSDILSGPPVFVQFELANRDDTELHHGTREPLWTAWTRPIRHPPYHDKKDVIYLAREDGLINFLECGDETEIETSVSMGSVDCNIDTAFASLFHLFADVLVTGGDSGPGAVWNVEARQSLQRIGSIPNWSPTVDFALTIDLTSRAIEEHVVDSSTVPLSNNRSVVSLRPDKVFACSGRGITGAITEFRYGIQARIGLDLTYSSNIRHCWAISDFDGASEDGFYLLLALPNGSAVLHLSRDLGEASEKDHDAVPYDLSSTTLAAQETSDAVVQVTSNYVTVVTPSGYYQNLISELIKDYTAVVADAAIREDKIALAVYFGSNFKIVLLSIQDSEVSLQHVFDVQGEVTCLTIEKLDSGFVVLAGLRQGEESTLAIYPAILEQHVPATPILVKLQPAAMARSSSVRKPTDNDVFGALTSLAYVQENSSGKQVIVAGTRSGDVLTIRLDQSLPGSYEMNRDRFGASPSHVFSGSVVGDPEMVLVCCDAELAILAAEEIQRVWPTDGDRPSMNCPPINSVAPLHSLLPEYGKSTMVMIAGPRIMVTDLQRRPKPVPRYFPVGGTPVKILYSSRLEALVTVVSKDGLPSLHFLDPVTGHDLSQPLERKKASGAYEYYDVDYITGLGNADTRAISLTTWTYRAAGIRGDWIVLAMRRRDNEGLLLIISAESENAPSQTSVPRRVRFWTKFDRKIRDGPIWSVATDESGVFLCVGNQVQYHIIEDNRFKVVRQHELPSPASWMQVVNKRLHVFTTKHSLVVLDYKSAPSPDGEQMIRLHTDDTCRNSLHSIEVGTSPNTITMLSDPMCGIHGLWAPPEDERPLKLVFQAELQASVRRFARGYTRALWGSSKNRPRFGCIQSGPVGSDILGLTIDGSIQHFSLLTEDAWRFLRFIQNLALRSPMICPHLISLHSNDDDDDESFGIEPNLDPKSNMQVDGDILQRCVERRALALLVSKPQHMQRLRELLEPLDEENVLQATREPPYQDGPYIKLAYRILAYYLAPVL